MPSFSRKDVIAFIGLLLLASGLWFFLRGDDSSSSTVAEENAALDELAASLLGPAFIQPDSDLLDADGVVDFVFPDPDIVSGITGPGSEGPFPFSGNLDSYLLIGRDTHIDGTYLVTNGGNDFADSVLPTDPLGSSRQDQQSGLRADEVPEVVIRGASSSLTSTDEPARTFLYNKTEYGCDETKNGHRTICASGAPIESDQLTAFMLLEADIPIDNTGDRQYTYALVLDADGQPGNNFVARPPFDWDTYQGSDYWIELIGENNEWRLQVTDWAAGDERGATVSGARAVIEANGVFFVVPLSDLPGTPTGFRTTTFVTQLDRMFDLEVSGVDSFPGPPDFGLHPIAPELVPLVIDIDG